MTDVALRVKMSEGDQVFMVPEGAQVTVDLRPDAPPGAKVLISAWGLNHVWPERPVPAPLVYHRGERIGQIPEGGDLPQLCDDEDCQRCQ